MKVIGIEKTMLSLVNEVKKRSEIIQKQVMGSALQKLADKTPVDTGYAKSNWRIEGNRIVNSAPYMSILNDGHSDQAPARFIEATLLADPRIKPAGIIVKYTHTED